MKKILGLIALTIVFTCCDIGTRESSAGTMVTEKIYSYGIVYLETKMVKDMQYDVYYQKDGGVHVVNVTKDELEVELLKLQIDSLKSK